MTHTTLQTVTDNEELMNKFNDINHQMKKPAFCHHVSKLAFLLLNSKMCLILSRGFPSPKMRFYLQWMYFKS